MTIEQIQCFHYYHKLPGDLKNEILVGHEVINFNTRLVCSEWNRIFNKNNEVFISKIAIPQIKSLEKFLQEVKNATNLGERVICKLNNLVIWSKKGMLYGPSIVRNLYLLKNYVAIQNLRLLFKDCALADTQLKEIILDNMPEILKTEEQLPEDIEIDLLTKEFSKLQLISPYRDDTDKICPPETGMIHTVETNMRTCPNYTNTTILRPSPTNPGTLTHVENINGKVKKYIISNETLKQAKLKSLSGIYIKYFHPQNTNMANGEDYYFQKECIYRYDGVSDPNLKYLDEKTKPKKVWENGNQATVDFFFQKIDLLKYTLFYSERHNGYKT